MLHQEPVKYGQILFLERFIGTQPCSLLYVLSIAAPAITTVALSSCERDCLAPSLRPRAARTAVLPLLRLVSVVALIAVGRVLVCAQVTSLLGRPQKWCQVRRWQEHCLSLEKPRVSSFFFLFDNELVCSGGVRGNGGVPETGAGGSWGEHGSGVGGTGNLGLVAPPAPSLSRSQHVHLYSDLSGTCPPLPHPAFLSGHSEHQAG